MNRILLIFLLGLMALLVLPAQAQSRAGSWAWKPMLKHDGVEFKYIFYSEANSENDGVVVMLINRNDYPVVYQFKIVFRAEGDEVVRYVYGELNARQAKTGDADGLFWIPFEDGRTIAEVGLRGYKIIPKNGT